jgi:hypothetical protein
VKTTLFAATMLAVSAQTPMQPFAGIWTRAFNGQLQVRLELREAAGALTGQISLGTVHTDRNGIVDILIEPATDDIATPISDVALRDGVLSFARKDREDGHTDRFELRRVGDSAELTFLLTPEFVAAAARDGIGAMKPIRLTRSPR